MHKINNRVKLLRKRLRINQKTFGEYIGKSQSAISDVEKSIIDVNKSWCLLIETAYNVNPDWLRHGIGDMGDVSLPSDRRIKERSVYYIGERLSQIRDSFHLSLDEFASSLGLPPSRVYALEENQEQADIDLIKRIAHLTGCDDTWLAIGKGHMSTLKKQTSGPSPREYPLIPIIKGPVPAGIPTPASFEADQIEDYFYVPDVPRNALGVRVKGDSMMPTIRGGDYVFFIPATIDELSNGNLVIVRNEWGDPCLKRYIMRDGEIYFESDNRDYPTLNACEGYTLVGRVIRVFRNIQF